MVVLVGAGLRFWHIHAGMPHRISVDEPVIAERAINMMRTGSFHPGFWDYPSLYIYLQLMVGCVRYVTGAMSGMWKSVNEFYPDYLFPWTRMLNAAIGTATIAMLYRAGARWGDWVALTAAGILAVWPNHVRESHFALTDVPLTFFTVAALVVSLRAFQGGGRVRFAAAGACAGLAAATKYPGAYALVLPVVAAAVHPAALSRRAAYGVVAVVCGCLTFLAAAPYTVLDLPGFLNGFGNLSRFYSPRDFTEGGQLYVAHVRAAAGWTGLIAIAAGFIWGTVRAVRNGDLRAWAILTVFPMVYFYIVATKFLIFARYLLPIVPFLCLIMAIPVVDAVRAVWRLRYSRSIRVAVVTAGIVLILFPVVKAGIEWPAQYGRKTTQDVAYEQILAVVPQGSGVVVERSVLRLPESLYRTTNVPMMTMWRPEDYVAKGSRFLVASSDAFGAVLEHPSQHETAYLAYQDVFSRPGHCLPAVQPGRQVSGQQIIICRFDAPIGTRPPQR